MSLARFLEPSWEWIHTPLDQRPLVSTEAMVGISIGYVVMVWSLQRYMEIRKGEPFNIKYLTIVHNFFMAVYSFYALLGTWDIVFENWSNSGFDLNLPFCDPDAKLKKGTDWWLYSFYLSKFLEYIDTIFLLLKNKKILPWENGQAFLHVFHHSTTASIVWTTWLFPLSVFWVGPITNAFVHTIMYGYYFLVELYPSIRWFGGKYITPIQLIQFVICMASVSLEIYKNCGSDNRVVIWVFATYIVFFLFFVQVWLEKRKLRHEERAKGQPPAKKGN